MQSFKITCKVKLVDNSWLCSQRSKLCKFYKIKKENQVINVPIATVYWITNTYKFNAFVNMSSLFHNFNSKQSSEPPCNINANYYIYTIKFYDECLFR